MYCQSCGAHVEDGERFCERCGAPIDYGADDNEPQSDATSPIVASPPAAGPARVEPVHGDKKLHLLIGTALTLVLVCVAMALINRGSGTTAILPEDTSEPVPEGDDSQSQTVDGEVGLDEPVDAGEGQREGSESSSISSGTTAVAPSIQTETTPQGSTPPTFDQAFASSSLPGDDTTSYYGPYNAIDGDYETAWNEGAEGPGIGQSISIQADSPQYVTSVSIMGGFPKILAASGNDVYYQNCRPKEITVSYEGGQETFTMSDLRGEFQTFVLSRPASTRYLTITIDSVYPGSTYEDCCIAEIEVS